MLKDPKLLKSTLIDFIKSQLLQHRKDGVVVHLDGSLTSLVNAALAKELVAPYKFKVVICTFSDNRQYLKHITAAVQALDLIYEVRDLQKDYDTLSSYALTQGVLKDEIAYRKLFADFMVHLLAAQHNLMPLGNLCYSQWILDYPHNVYKNLGHIHTLNRLYYSEVIDFAEFLGIPKMLTERKPSHYIRWGQSDEEDLKFTYSELENFLRNSSVASTVDQEIQKKLVKDDRNKFIGPPIQRPSNLIG